MKAGADDVGDGSDERGKKATVPETTGGVVVCCTGFRRDERRELTAAVAELGGVFDGNLTQQTTHLVCASVRSDKYTVARSEGFCQCVTREWLDRSRAAGRFLADTAPYAVRPLLRCVVCCTQFTAAEGAELRRAVVQLGGVFTEDYMANVTHLVAKRARGEKYKCAHSRGAFVVAPAWVFDSLARDGLPAHTPSKTRTETHTDGQ